MIVERPDADMELVRQSIFDAIDELNLMRAADDRLEKSDATVLLGTNSCLDSLEVVNLVVGTEMNLEAATGVSLDLAGGSHAADGANPFSTVGALAEHICRLIRENSITSPRV